MASVRVTVADEASEGEYSVKVNSLGSYSALIATEFTAAGDEIDGTLGRGHTSVPSTEG